MKSWRHFRFNRRGATAVEFAMVVWPATLIMLGVIEISRLVWIEHAVLEVVTSAARCVGIRAIPCGRQGSYAADLAIAFVHSEAAKWGLSITDTGLVIDDNATCNGASGFSRVSLSLPVTSPLPILANMLYGSDHRLTVSACFPTQAQ